MVSLICGTYIIFKDMKVEGVLFVKRKEIRWRTKRIKKGQWGEG
jgi:hypothetical protein